MRKNSRITHYLVLAGLLSGQAAAFAEESKTVSSNIERGKAFYAAKDYASAIKTWSQVLGEDPLNQEAVALIEDARFQADYQVAVLDKLQKEERLKTPYASELSKIAGEMSKLLEKAKSKLEERNREASSEVVSKTEAQRFEAERQASLREIYKRGAQLLERGSYEQAFDEWEKIVPSLPEEHRLRQKVESLKSVLSEQAASSSAVSSRAVPAPESMAPLLESLDQRLRSETEKLASLKSSRTAKDDSQMRLIESEFKRGKDFYDKQDYANAVAVWKALTPYFSDGEKIRILLERVKSGQAALEQASLAGAPVASQAVEAPESLGIMLTSLDQRLKAETDRLTALKKAQNAKSGELAQFVKAEFERGRVFYEQQNYLEAINSWKLLTPNLLDGDKLSALLEKLRADFLVYQKAMKDAQGLGEAGLGNKLEADPKIEAMLRSALVSIQERTRELAAQAKALNGQKQAQKDQYAASVDKANQLLLQGNVPAAVDMLNTVIPNLSNADKIGPLLEKMRADHASLQQASERARQAQAESGSKLMPDPAIEATLQSSLSRIQSETERLRSEAKMLTEKKETVRSLASSNIENANKLLAQGDTLQAIDVLSSVMPSLSSTENLNALLQKVRTHHAELQKASEEARKAQSESVSKLEPDPAIEAALLASLTRIETETGQFQSRVKTLSEQKQVRRSQSASAVEKADQLLSQGDVPAAIDILAAIAPSLANGDKIAALLEKARKDYAAFQQASEQAKIAENESALKLEADPALEKALQTSQSRIQAQTQQLLSQAKALSDKRLAQKDRTRSSVEKADQLLSKNDVPGGLEVLRSVAGDLANSEKILPLIEAVRADYAAYEAAAAEAQKTQQESASKLPADAAVEAALQSSLTKIKLDTEKLAIETRYLTERKQGIKTQTEAGLQKVQDLLQQGNILWALDILGTVSPHLANADKINPLLEKARADYSALQEASQAVKKAQEESAAKLEPNPAIEAALASSMARIQAEIAQSQASLKQMREQRQTVVKSTDENTRKALELLAQKNIVPALDLLRPVAAHLANGENISSLVEKLASEQSAYTGLSQEIKKAQEEASTKLAPNPAIESALQTSLSEIQANSQKMKDELKAFQDERQALKAQTEAGLEKSKSLLADGSLPAAIDALAPVAGNLANGDKIDQLIQKARADYAAFEAELQNSKNARTALSAKFEPDDAVEKTLSASLQRIQESIDKLRAETKSLDDKTAARKDWARNIIQSGKTLWDQGLYQEALETWKLVIAELKEGNPTRKLFTDLQTTWKEYQQASITTGRQQAAASHGQFGVEETFVSSLQTARQELRKKADLLAPPVAAAAPQTPQKKESAPINAAAPIKAKSKISPKPEVLEEVVPSPTEEAQIVLTQDTSGRFALVGVDLRSGMAVVVNKVINKTYFMKKGATMDDGIRLCAIFKDRIVLEESGKRFQVVSA